MNLRALLFQSRSYTPIPLLAATLVLAQSSVGSFIGGGALVLFGESIRLWAVGYAGSATRTRHVGAPMLITNGPYAYVRNPIYVGNFILSLGFCVMAWAWMPYMAGLFLLAFGVQYSMIVSLEEEHLRETFGEEYGRYLDGVPRFVPSLHRYPHASAAGFDLRAALRSDRRTFQSIAAVTVALVVKALVYGS